jgi:DNA-binding IclR family transcriptional regulator
LLQNLIGRGYINFSSTSKGYKLGDAFNKLAQRTSQTHSLDALASPILDEIAEETLESCTLNRLKGDQSEVIATVSSKLRLVSHMRVGDAGPLYALSSGKAMRAAMPDAMVEEYLGRVVFERITPKTITSSAELRREIAQVRKQGVAYSLEEFTLGISGIGVAVQADSDFPLGALALAIPTVRFTPEAKARGIRVLKDAAELIRRRYVIHSGESTDASLGKSNAHASEVGLRVSGSARAG